MSQNYRRKVFISSTGLDLSAYRAAAIETCNKLGLIPLAMEFFEAMGEGATDASNRKLDGADLYVGIIAHRYGYIEEGQSVSVTESEFNHATRRGIRRLCFIVDPKYPWSPEAIDYEHHAQLTEFKNRVLNSLVCNFFGTVDSFKAALMHSLVKWMRATDPTPSPSVPSQDERFDAALTAPPTPTLFFGRRRDVNAIRKMLLQRSSQSATAGSIIIRGWPGVGKTTLVNNIAHDRELLAHLTDGVLWAALGEHADLRSILTSWARALRLRIGRDESLNGIRELVRDAIARRRMLLVVDDAMTSESALGLTVGGVGCATVITTRLPIVAAELAPTPSDIYVLNPLAFDDALLLLKRLAPRAVQQYPVACRELVRDLEGLPLAVRVAARLIEQAVGYGADIQELFRSLRDRFELLEAKAPEDRFDARTGTTPTVDLLLQRSTGDLPDTVRERFAYLGVMAPKPATFDLKAMAYIWETTDEEALRTARVLVDRGLLEPVVELGRFQLHALLALHARSLLGA